MNHFDVDLQEGLIEVLEADLYSSPDVATRELLQNASDAIVQSGHHGTIRVRYDHRARTLSFDDDGVGMDTKTIRESLARIGASMKRGAATDDGVIGHFGIGLLAVFLISDTFIVETKREGESPLRWVGRSDGTFDLEPGTRRQTGTCVTVPPRRERRIPR